MRQIAYIVGVESYMDSDIEPVLFAEEDARGMKKALLDIGFADDDVILTLSQEATKTLILSKLKRVVRSLSKDDAFYFYFAGHGFSRNGANHIMCTDTSTGDWTGTSISLQEILELIKVSNSKIVVLFIDACQSGLPFEEDTRSVYLGMAEDEILEFFSQAKGSVCFSACRSDELSYHDRSVRHGIWSYHVIEALSGNAPQALENNRYITTESLQNYLAKTVPTFVRKTRGKDAIQTPWMYCAADRGLLIADLGMILSKKKRKASPFANQLRRAIIGSLRAEYVKSLGGFRRGSHNIPKYVNATTQSFIEGIGEQDLKARIDVVFNRLRKHLRYKGRDLVTSVGAGRASIITPQFDFYIEMNLDESDPSTVILHEYIENISDGELILSEEFSEVFPEGFDSVDFIFREQLDIAAIVDQLEDFDQEKFELIYDSSYTKVEVNFVDYNAKITVEADRLRIRVARSMSPKKLLPMIEIGLQHLTNHDGFSTLPLLRE